MVCRWDFETRQPQDFVRGVADKIVPPYTRPEQGNVFVPRNYISTTNSGGGAGVTIDTGINLAPVATVTDSFSYTRTVVSVATIPANALGSRVINVKLLG